MNAIKYCHQFNLALSQGAYAWPGGYPLYFLCADGEALSFEMAAMPDIAPLIRDAIIAGPGAGDEEWRVVAVGVNWEDDTLTCAHSGKAIECAYPSDDEQEEN